MASNWIENEQWNQANSDYFTDAEFEAHLNTLLDMPTQTRHAAAAEVVDLTEDIPATETSLSNHQEASIRKRKRSEEVQEQIPKDIPAIEGQTKIGKMSCIICMETYTNATIAHCGHIFCHECLTRALIASERHHDRGVGTCPSCRKPVTRKKAGNVIPINFLKKEAYQSQRS